MERSGDACTVTSKAREERIEKRILEGGRLIVARWESSSFPKIYRVLTATRLERGFAFHYIHNDNRIHYREWNPLRCSLPKQSVICQSRVRYAVQGNHILH